MLWIRQFLKQQVNKLVTILYHNLTSIKDIVYNWSISMKKKNSLVHCKNGN